MCAASATAGASGWPSLAPGDCLGEMALVTGDPRSATVVTLSATRLLRLDKERFQVLSDRQPAFFRELARALCRRIARTSADVAHARRAYTTVFDTILDGAEPPARRLLEVLAVAKRADAGVLIATLGANGPRIATEVAAHHPALVFQDERGRYELHPEFRDHVRRRLADANGTDATHELHVAVATAHGDEEAWAKGARHWLAAGRWDEAAHAIRKALASSAPPTDAELETWLDRLPEDMLLQADLGPAKASLLVRTGRSDAASALLERAFSGQRLDGVARDRLAEPGDLTRSRAARGCGGRHGRRVTRCRDADGGRRPVGHRPRAGGRGRRRRALDPARRARAARGALPRGARGGHGALGVGQRPRLRGRPRDGHRVGCSCVAPTATAFGGFATSTWFLMLGVLGLGAALARSGLLYRITLIAVRRFPPRSSGRRAPSSPPASCRPFSSPRPRRG